MSFLHRLAPMRWAGRVICGFAALSSISIHAATVYWDINGTTAGSGSATPTGNWGTGTATWGDSGGTAATANWVNGDSAVFSAGTDGSGAFTVTVNTPITVAAITREEGSTITISATSANTITCSGGALAIDTGSGTLIYNAFYAPATGVITKTGSGLLSVGTSQSAQFGKWIINNGGLSAAGDLRLGTAPPSLVADQVTLNGGKFRSSTAAVAFDVNRGMRIGAGGGTFDQQASVVLTWNGPISGTSGGSLTIGTSSTAVTILTSTGNSYDGDTVIATGTLRLGAAGVIPDTSIVRMTTSTTFDLNGNSETIKALGRNGASAGGSVTLGAATLTIDPGSPTELYNSTISGTGGKLVKSGAGIWTNSCTGTYTGGFTMNAGSLYIGGNAAFGTGTLTINGGKIVAINTRAPTVAVDLAGDVTFGETGQTGTFTFGTGAWTLKTGNRQITADNVTTTINSAIGEDAPGRGLTVAGSGTLTLGGVNSYTGPTTVSSGRLNVNGSLAAASAVTAAAGAVLGGSGAINGTLSVSSGATLAPGTSIGTLTLAATPTLGGNLSMEISKAASPNADKLVVVGNPLAFGGILTVNNIGAALTGGETFDLFDATSFSGSFTATNLPALGAGLNWWTDNLGLDGTITVNRAPTALDKPYTRQKGVTLKIAKSDLMIGTSDADSGDSVSFDALASNGTQGATVTQDANFIYYEPVNDNNDTLQYRVKDTRGGFTTKNIPITVVSGNGQSQIVAVTGGTVTVSFAGVPGYTYQIQRSTNLVDWATLVTTNAPAGGVFEWTDTFSDLNVPPDPPPSSAYYQLHRP